LAIQHT